jgi:MioC protein
MLSEPVIILVATMGGTATYVAEELAAALADKGGKGFVVPMEKAALEMFAKRKYYIICSSSHGTGDIPDNGFPFFEKLRAERPDLTNIRYGTVALGDMTYSASFCGGGKQFDELFEELGAKRLVDRLEHDRQRGGFPEDEAIEWLDGWLQAAGQ